MAPSLEDNLPNTILESLNCETPVVAFNVGGIPNMVVHKGNGYLSDYKDSNDLMRGIDWCLNNLEKVRLRNVNLEKEKSINILLEIYKK